MRTASSHISRFWPLTGKKPIAFHRYSEEALARPVSGLDEGMIKSFESNRRTSRSSSASISMAERFSFHACAACAAIASKFASHSVAPRLVIYIMIVNAHFARNPSLHNRAKSAKMKAMEKRMDEERSA